MSFKDSNSSPTTPIRAAMGFMITLTGALLISFLFFTGIAKLHSLFGISQQEQTTDHQAPRILTEVVRRPPPAKRTTQQSVRTLSTGGKQHRAEGDPSAPPSRFTPDLGIEGGSESNGVSLAGQELAAEIFEEGQADEDAIALSQPAIPYPERARDMGLQGTFEAFYIVNNQGNVTSITITKSPGNIISAEARKTLQQWRFKPARNKGVPVNQRNKLILNFILE